MKKKLLSILLASTAAFTACAGLAACGSDPANTITVWCPDAAVKPYEARVESFKEKYPDYANYEFSFLGKSEGECLAACQADIKTASDIFFFASDHIETMVKNKYLLALPKAYADDVEARDVATAVNAIKSEGKIYGFPATADNGYFLYYVKSAFPNESDVATLDQIVAKGKESTPNKSLLFKYDDAFYGVSFFIGCGGDFGYNANGTYRCNFNDDTANSAGIKPSDAATAAYNYLAPSKNGQTGGESPEGGVIRSYGDNDAIGKAFENGTAIAGIGGTWCYDDVVKSGVEFGVAKLPTFTVGEGASAKQVQMGSFMGAKYGGVNPYVTSLRSEEKIAAATAFLDWLTNEEGQLARYNASNAGPSNKNAQNDSKVKADKTLKALNDQNNAGGYMQLNQDGMWDLVKDFNDSIYKNKTEESAVATELDELVTALKALGSSVS